MFLPDSPDLKFANDWSLNPDAVVGGSAGIRVCTGALTWMCRGALIDVPNDDSPNDPIAAVGFVSVLLVTD